MCVSGCVFKQVHTSCSSLRRTFLMTVFFTSETRIFCFHCKRKVCESHEVTISSSYTLTYTFAIISAQGPPVSPTQASCPPFCLTVFCRHLVCVAKGDQPRRFFAGTISTHSNSTRIILALFVFNNAKHIAIGISKSLRTTCTGRPSLRPSPSNPPGALRVSRAFTMAMSAALACLHSSKPPSYLETLTGERSECGSQDGGEDDEDTFTGLES